MKLFRTYTWRSLMANRTRTWVTIIGIILSVALLTAVACGAYSGQQYLIRAEVADEGAYHCLFRHVTGEELAELRSDERMDQVATLDSLGYAPYQQTADSGVRPYLHIAAASDNIRDLLSITITQGRMPQNGNEALMPTSVFYYGGTLPELGQTITLDIGQRTIQGEVLDQNNSYVEGEVLSHDQTVTYTVVGYYENLSWDVAPANAPGIPVLTGGGGRGDNLVLCTLENPADAKDLMMEDPWGTGSSAHYGLLRYYGVFGNDAFMVMLYGLMAILMALIVFGSVSLIYNSFAISVAQRTKQFGLLKSLGATRRQIRFTVLYEALVLCLVGIPVGLVIGVGGIGITLYLLRDSFDLLLGQEGVSMGLRVAPRTLILSAAVGLLTALISAWIPARRAVKLTPMEALRQTADVKIRPRQLKVSRLTEKLFGYAGVLAAKNFKRNRRSYRTTIVSLFMSLVLFISASSFTLYLNQLADSSTDIYAYDLMYRGDTSEIDPEEFLARSRELAGIETGTYFSSWEVSLQVPTAALDDSYFTVISAPGDTQEIQAKLGFLRDADWLALASESGIEPDLTDPAALVFDGDQTWVTNQKGRTLVPYRCFPEGQVPETLSYGRVKELEGYLFSGYQTQNGGETQAAYVEEAIAYGWKESQDPDDGWLYLPVEEALEWVPLTVAGLAPKERPYYVEQHGLVLVYPWSAREAILGPDAPELAEFTCLYLGDDHGAAYDALEAATQEWGLTDSYVYDYAVENDASRAVTLVLRVFSYGFIVLITGIAVANVFNTISTNIGLRRRELAMLRSVGMSQGELRRMMRYECLLYGSKALLYGLPVSIGVSWLIWRSITVGYGMDFLLPWGSILLAVGSVFLVVFATMLYAMDKLRDHNVIEDLRCENL